MKRLMAFVLVLVQSVVAGDSFGEKFAKLQKEDDTTGMWKFLDKAAETEAGNPDYYAKAGAYWWHQSRAISITTKPSEEGDFSIRDPESGKEVGSIGTTGKLNRELAAKAVGILGEGASKFPVRADIALGLAHVHKEMGKFDKCVDALLALLETAGKDPSALTWMDNGALPNPAAQFIPETVQGYTTGLFRKGTPETDVLCAKLCKAVTAAFPDHPFAYNIQAALADTKGDQAEVLRLLAVASSKAPDDVLILLNLADARRKAGENEKALEAYRKVLGLKAEEEHKKKAEEAIRELEGES